MNATDQKSAIDELRRCGGRGISGAAPTWGRIAVDSWAVAFSPSDEDPVQPAGSLQDATLELLRFLPNLAWLDLWGTDITDVGLDHMTCLAGLRGLEIDDTHVTAVGIQKLKSLTNLTALEVTIRDPSMHEAVAELSKSLPNLQVNSRIQPLDHKHSSTSVLKRLLSRDELPPRERTGERKATS